MLRHARGRQPLSVNALDGRRRVTVQTRAASVTRPRPWWELAAAALAVAALFGGVGLRLL
jgi:hypothetical protein